MQWKGFEEKGEKCWDRLLVDRRGGLGRWGENSGQPLQMWQLLTPYGMPNLMPEEACEERRKKGPSMYLIPEGIHLQDCKSVVESVRREISGIIPYLVCELAVLNMNTLNPTVKTFPFAAWGVKTLWGLLFLVPEL